MTVVVSPATILDLAALSGAMTRRQWAVARIMYAEGDISAVRAGGRLVALGYLYPLADGTAEAGFNPSAVDDEARGLGRAAPHMLAILRATRLTLASSAYSAIVTECATRAGERLARAAGFQPSGRKGVAGEIWTYGHADGRDGAETAAGARAAVGTVRGGAAPEPRADGSGAGPA